MAIQDAIVIGAGPNGLAAAIVIAQAGRKVTLFEAEQTVGGGARSAALTLPGFTHDVCSAIHPFALASPFFRTLPLARYGLEWIEPPAMLAHPFDDGTSALVHRALDSTAEALNEDGPAYRRRMGPRIEQQIERYAPGFRDRVLARTVAGPADIERRNPNMVGGDIGSGATDLGQLFTRPTWRT